jgi:hypothetical protein
MTRAALLAEKMNQHSGWFNTYDRLGVASSIHARGQYHRSPSGRSVLPNIER